MWQSNAQKPIINKDLTDSFTSGAQEQVNNRTRNIINPVANEDVRQLRAFSLNQPQFPYWRPPWERLAMQQLAVMPIMQCNGIWRLASLPVRKFLSPPKKFRPPIKLLVPFPSSPKM